MVATHHNATRNSAPFIFLINIDATVNQWVDVFVLFCKKCKEVHANPKGRKRINDVDGGSACARCCGGQCVVTECDGRRG